MIKYFSPLKPKNTIVTSALEKIVSSSIKLMISKVTKQEYTFNIVLPIEKYKLEIKCEYKFKKKDTRIKLIQFKYLVSNLRNL